MWRDRVRQVRRLPSAMVEQRREVHELARSVPALEAEIAGLRDQLRALRAVVEERPGLAYVADGHAWVRTTWGGKVLVDTADLLIAPWLMLDGVWEPAVGDFVRSVLRPGDVFVDVGANVGYFTILAADAIRHVGHIYAFEANPATYELLQKTVTVNWMTSFITTEQLAVYEDTRTLEFVMPEHFAGNSSLALDDRRREAPRIEVETISLDEYFAGRDMRADLVKVDVEGAELFVFRGMRKLVAANPALVVVCEWSQADMGDHYDPSDLLDEIAAHGFDTFHIGAEVRPIGRAELLDTPYANLALRPR